MSCVLWYCNDDVASLRMYEYSCATWRSVVREVIIIAAYVVPEKLLLLLILHYILQSTLFLMNK